MWSVVCKRDSLKFYSIYEYTLNILLTNDLWSREKLMSLRFWSNLNCSCLQIKLICTLLCYPVSLMNYNEVTFRIFTRKKQFDGKERISGEHLLGHISEESPWSLSCIYYIQGWLVTIVACNTEHFFFSWSIDIYRKK